MAVPRKRDDIAELFRSSGQEVTEVVGAQPGEIWRFAQPTMGFFRPRTLWQVWMDQPADWTAALDALERMRVVAGADRALGILLEGPLPAGYSTDIERGPSTAITVRRLALALAGVPEHVRKVIDDYDREQGSRYFLRRRGMVNSEPVDDMVEYLVRWSQSDRSKGVLLVGHHTGRKTLVREVAYRVARMFLEDPEHIRPLLHDAFDSQSHAARFSLLRSRDWVRWIGRTTDRALPDSVASRDALYLLHEEAGDQTFDEALYFVCEILPVAELEIIHWYRTHLPTDAADVLTDAYRSNADLAALLRELSLLRRWVTTFTEAPLRHSDRTSEHAAHAVVSFFRQVSWIGMTIDKWSETLETAALEDFALHASKHLLEVLDIGDTSLESLLDTIDIRYDEDGARFGNVLVRDYFLALKIIREVQADHRDILTRYQFPREHVLLFMAILSPEVSAFASEDRSNALRTEIEQQAEQEVQLVLAHHLKRSVGTIRTQMETLREHLPRSLGPQAEAALNRVDQELDYLRRLADRTRRLHQVPQPEITNVALADILNAVISDLRSSNPPVTCSMHVGSDLRVRGNRDSLEEIFSCLLENAFHAVAFDQQDPRVSLIVVDEEATVRVDVADNGPGVRAEDRARIFDPRVTTKKCWWWKIITMRLRSSWSLSRRRAIRPSAPRQ